MPPVLLKNTRIFDGENAERLEGQHREVFSPLESLRQATSVNADILIQKDSLGCVRAGAHADLLVVDGDPLKDIGLLAADGKHLKMIMRAGELIKEQLS